MVKLTCAICGKPTGFASRKNFDGVSWLCPSCSVKNRKTLRCRNCGEVVVVRHGNLDRETYLALKKISVYCAKCAKEVQ